MSVERAWVIGLPADPSVLKLVSEVRSAANRARKSDPGDRLDIARYEALATRLEHAALNRFDAPRILVSLPPGGPMALLGTDAKSWPTDLSDEIRNAANRLVAEQLLPVIVVNPHVRGNTEPEAIGAADEPAETWEADDGVFGSRAVEARFRAQINETLRPNAARRVPISPSGINNAVVTELLREFVVEEPGASRVDAPVEYRDGSKSGHPFPLRSLPLLTTLPPASLELSFALLSIRHTEMDAVVHGAWLRNAEVSRPRPAAQTDDLVYDISLRQLEELCRSERHVRLNMYQTGLETAVVGFYRALTIHLLRFPESVSVQPMYYVTPRKPKQVSASQRETATPSRGLASYRGSRPDASQGSRGRAERDRSHPSVAEPAALLTTSSTFRKGTVWTT